MKPLLRRDIPWAQAPKRPDVDYVVDRSQMEAEQSVESSDTNRSCGFKKIYGLRASEDPGLHT